jgi:hypothetical protein
MRHARTVLLALLVSLPTTAFAEPMKRDEVPAPLQPWISWALRGHEAEFCSFLHGRGAMTCAWPGVLSLTLDEGSGRFEQSWRAEADEWVPLPGGADRWPQDVRVDGAAAAVVERDGAPSVRLKAGNRKIGGAFRWSRLPEQLEIPFRVGLLSLTVRGKPMPFPLRDDAGRLWLQAQARVAPVKEESHLDITVHRRLIDEVPLQVLTRIQLKISGSNREVVLGRPLPEGFAPLSLVSALPARLDPDGRLRVQARSGTWEIMLFARREGAGDEIKLPAPGGPWAADEAWVFEAHPELRQADVDGAPTLDPQQTELPMDWRNLPAYLVRPSGSLKLVQRRRGDDPPAPDRLSLNRELWLDFDGGGFTVRDRLSGTLGKSWRLESAPETKLGRVSAGGGDQFLTALSSGGPAGLEIRTRQVNVEADSRVTGRELTATGWKHDFESVSARLHLPPGWKIFAVTGADSASPTWVTNWTLLDFFLVLIAAAAFARLYGRAWGAAGLIGLALMWHEPGAPRWAWLAVLLFAALDRVLVREPAFSIWVRRLRIASWIVLALIALPFFVTQIRHGMYPVLEKPYQSVSPQAQNEPQDAGEVYAAPRAASPAPMRKARRAEASLRGGALGMISGATASLEENDDKDEAAAEPAAPPEPSFYSSVLTQMRLDPTARVTTGPGLPYWNWDMASISWRGPVPQGHRLHLWLIPPCVNLGLALLRVLLSVLLALLLAEQPVGAWLDSLRGPEGRARLMRAVLPLVLLAFAAARAAAADGFPPKELMDEFRAALLQKPSCAPNCADSPRLQITATADWLSLKWDVHAAAVTAVPIPTGGREWTPARGTLDGAPISVLREPDGSLWTPILPGAHVLVLEGPLPARDAIQLALPLKPRRVDASVSGWTLGGVREDGRAEDNLQLSRARGAQPAAAEAAAARAQGIFPPFLRVERVLRLGLSWTVETTVTRLTPLGSPVVVKIPLLPGEAVTSSEMRAVDGKISVSLPPQSPSTSWSSVLSETSSLKLAAPSDVPWTEVWRVEPGPLWHLEARGLPPTYQDPGAGPRTLAYRPWPGEALDLAISRPGSVVGQTLTIDQSTLRLSPGMRATDATLSLRLRTSRGDRETVTLPEGAELLAARLDGAQQPLRLEGRRLSFSVTPGAHQVEADWRQPGGARFFYRAPDVDLGAAAVNSHVEIAMPSGRWTLLAGGRGLGPVVLFWSVLAVFLLASIGLSKTGLAPLSWRHWFLLSLGLTQLSAIGAGFIAGWFLLVGLRGARPPLERREFNLAQLFVAGWTAAAAFLLFGAIRRGLLGAPNMQIAGNGSSESLLRWYVDRAGTSTPRPWALSVPLFAYRAAMLLWALWLADSLLTWSRWAWDRFTIGGLWKSKA